MGARMRTIPKPVVKRLPEYLACLRQMKDRGQAWVISRELAQALDLTESTVRQDLTHLDFTGTAKRGYEIGGLARAITKALGLDVPWNTVIVGAGEMGRALALNLNEDLSGRAFSICGIFDSDPGLLGKTINGIVVQSTDGVPDVVRREGVDIGIVAVPAAAAQQMADRLVVAGVRGLLNLTSAHIAVPQDVPMVDERMIAGLQELSCAIEMQAAVSKLAAKSRDRHFRKFERSQKLLDGWEADMDQPSKILVVDDDPDFLNFARTVLESNAYKVVLAPGEEEALAEIEAERPDLLVLDVMMSKWDSGFQFMWKLKADDRHKAIPILMVTGVDEEVHIDYARHAVALHRTADDEEYLPVDDYLLKPVKTSELLSSVNTILKRAEKRAASK